MVVIQYLLVLSIPIAFLFQKFENKTFFEKKFKFLVIIVIIIFNFKNSLRINDEFQRTDNYKFDNFPFLQYQKKIFF